MSKVQSATVRLVMKKCKVNSIGQHPIYLSVCYNARKEKSTGIFIEERYWNPLKEEVRKGCNEPLIETEQMTLYVARHTKANDYLSHPGATIHGLATLMGRSVAGLDTYVHMIRNDRDLAAAESLSSI